MSHFEAVATFFSLLLSDLPVNDYCSLGYRRTMRLLVRLDRNVRITLEPFLSTLSIGQHPSAGESEKKTTRVLMIVEGFMQNAVLNHFCVKFSKGFCVRSHTIRDGTGPLRKRPKRLPDTVGKNSMRFLGCLYYPRNVVRFSLVHTRLETNLVVSFD